MFYTDVSKTAESCLNTIIIKLSEKSLHNMTKYGDRQKLGVDGYRNENDNL